jgi:hypothetical protein
LDDGYSSREGHVLHRLSRIDFGWQKRLDELTVTRNFSPARRDAETLCAAVFGPAGPVHPAGNRKTRPATDGIDQARLPGPGRKTPSVTVFGLLRHVPHEAGVARNSVAASLAISRKTSTTGVRGTTRIAGRTPVVATDGGLDKALPRSTDLNAPPMTGITLPRDAPPETSVPRNSVPATLEYRAKAVRLFSAE